MQMTRAAWLGRTVTGIRLAALTVGASDPAAPVAGPESNRSASCEGVSCPRCSDCTRTRTLPGCGCEASSTRICARASQKYSAHANTVPQRRKFADFVLTTVGPSLCDARRLTLIRAAHPWLE